MQMKWHKKYYDSKTIRGKHKVCRYLAANPSLRPHVPATEAFSREQLLRMAKRYRAIYIKRDVGSMGVGVYKLTRTVNGYHLQATRNRKQTERRFTNLTKLYRHLQRTEFRKMIIQKDVGLDRVRGRPYDIRAMVQRKPGESWACTGFLIKVGVSGKIVTNYHQGGKLYSIRQWLKMKRFSPTKRSEVEAFLKRKALQVAKTLSRRQSGMYEMGIDFAYDRKQRLWILEVNSNYPEFRPIQSLDPAAYRRMRSYARSYGRT